jgi:hypothetical protein
MLTWLAAAAPSDAPLAPLVGAAVAAAAGGTVVLCLSSEGRAASELGGARTTIGRAGATPVVVAAAASTWGEGREGALVSGGEANIVSVADRVLRRDRSLGSCLEA